MHEETASKSRSTRRSQRKAARRTRRIQQGVVGGAVLALLGTSIAFADTDDPAGAQQAAGDVSADRAVWSQVSRSGVERMPLDGDDAVTFEVSVDGDTDEVTSAAPTLAAALAAAGIVVGFDDDVSESMSAAPTEGMEVEIVRGDTRTEVFTEDLPYETEKEKTDSLPEGTEEVETEGEDGERKVTALVTYSNDEEIDRQVLAEVVGAEPVTEVVLIGTGDPEDTGGDESDESSASEDDAPTESYSGEDPRGIAQDMLSDFGWGDDQWQCLKPLWDAESGWDPHAANPSSGAYGIPQALPGSKMAAAGSDWKTNPATQIKWGLGYVEDRYGSPCGGWSHFQSNGWY